MYDNLPWMIALLVVSGGYFYLFRIQLKAFELQNENQNRKINTLSQKMTMLNNGLTADVKVLNDDLVFEVKSLINAVPRAQVTMTPEQRRQLAASIVNLAGLTGTKLSRLEHAIGRAREAANTYTLDELSKMHLIDPGLAETDESACQQHAICAAYSLLRIIEHTENEPIRKIKEMAIQAKAVESGALGNLR